MKQKFKLCIIFLSMFISVSCRTKKNSAIGNIVTDNPVVSTTIDPLPEPSVTKTTKSTDKDSYIGEYSDMHENKDMLEIQKGKNDIYYIEIGVYGHYVFECCGCINNNNKLEFITRYKYNKDLFEGTITLNNNCAIVTFYGDDWCNFDNTNTYKYHKTSDIPFEHYFDEQFE